MIEQLIKDMMSEKHIIPICSFKDCRKIRIGSDWYKTDTYDPEYKNYSHSLCTDCKEKHYGNIKYNEHRKR